MINKEVSSLYLDYTTLEDAISQIEREIEIHGKDAKIRHQQAPYSDHYVITIYKDVLETDKEEKTREANEKRHAEYQDEKDVEEFKRLQKKFKNNS